MLGGFVFCARADLSERMPPRIAAVFPWTAAALAHKAARFS